VQTLVTRFEVSENLACQISPSSPDIAPANGKPSDQNTRLAWDITNSSGKDLEIVTIAIAWTSILGPHRLMQIEYPEGTIVQTYTGGTTGPVLADFSFIPLLLRVNSGSGCSGSSCVRMAAVWDSKILAGGGIGEVLTITYAFRDPAGSLGACSFSVKPDLSFN
jgi:hypothetical protein